MKVIVPDKLKDRVKEALTELYLLEQAVKNGASSPDSLIKHIKKIRNILKKS